MVWSRTLCDGAKEGRYLEDLEDRVDVVPADAVVEGRDELLEVAHLLIVKVSDLEVFFHDFVQQLHVRSQQLRKHPPSLVFVAFGRGRDEDDPGYFLQQPATDQESSYIFVV